MAEIVGLAASIIAVAELAEGVVRLCKAYIDGVKDAPRDLRVILVEVSTLQGLLDSITLLRDTPLLVEKHDLLSTQVDQVHEILSEIEGLLGEQQVKRPGRKKQKVALSLSTLAWPLKKPRIMQRLDDISKCKNTISLILLADTSKDLKDIRQDIRDIKDKLSDDEREKILQKLTTVDPSSNHVQAHSLHERHTSDWITRSEKWISWLHGDLRLLWIHGIPGAGKTILASFMIEQVRSYCKRSSLTTPYGWSYYYCHHSRSLQTGESIPFLGWIIGQLSRQSGHVPSEIAKACRSGNAITSSDLITALAAIARRVEKVYIVLDALDECQHRPSFLALLQNLHSSPLLQNVHLLVTSRDELDIRRVMAPISTFLSMTNHLVDEDIRKYIHNQVNTDSKLSRWPRELLHEVENALANGAKGMFRWAACQLEILKRLNTASSIRTALTDLPETLDETYERILSSIPKESKHLAFRTLLMLCAPQPIRLDNNRLLAEAIRWTDLSENKPDDTLLEVDAIYEFCICLVRPKSNGTAILAHYTVKEYLSSCRIRSGPAQYFSLSQEAITQLSLRTYLNRLLWAETPDSELDLNFLRYCTKKLFPLLDTFQSTFLNDKDLFAAMCEFLHPANGHLGRIVRCQARPSLNETLELFDRYLITDGDAAELAARLCILGLQELAIQVIRRLDEPEFEALMRTTIPAMPVKLGNTTLLDMAARKQMTSLTHELIKKSRKPVRETELIFSILTWSGEDKREAEEVVEMALKVGANPNPPHTPFTPLQIAVNHGRKNLTASLLAAGADPNALVARRRTLEIEANGELDLGTLPDFESTLKPLDICRLRIEHVRIQEAKADGRLAIVLTPLDDLREIETLLIMYGATEPDTV